MGGVESEQGKETESKVRYKVPEGYLEEDRHIHSAECLRKDMEAGWRTRGTGCHLHSDDRCCESRAGTS